MPKQTKIRLKQRKEVSKTTEGKCVYCHKMVSSLEAHTKAKHLKEKFNKK